MTCTPPAPDASAYALPDTANTSISQGPPGKPCSSRMLATSAGASGLVMSMTCTPPAPDASAYALPDAMNTSASPWPVRVYVPSCPSRILAAGCGAAGSARSITWIVSLPDTSAYAPPDTANTSTSRGPSKA